MYNECCCCFYNFFVVVGVVGLVSKLNACWCFSFKWILKRCCCICVSSSTTNNNKKKSQFFIRKLYLLCSQFTCEYDVVLCSFENIMNSFRLNIEVVFWILNLCLSQMVLLVWWLEFYDSNQNKHLDLLKNRHQCSNTVSDRLFETKKDKNVKKPYQYLIWIDKNEVYATHAFQPKQKLLRKIKLWWFGFYVCNIECNP